MLAVISDVHADVHALRDALVQIERLGIEQVVCCGDIVDYGLFPEETLEFLRARRVPTVRGNHDRWAIHGSVDMSGWDLSDAAQAFLATLPAQWTARLGGLRVVATHARPGDDMHGISVDASDADLAALLDDASADVLLVGHTHVPFARTLGDGRLVCNPGALVRDPAPGTDVAAPGTLGVLSIEDGTATFEVRRAANGAPVELPERNYASQRAAHRG
jgi:putative phosphoesterase